MYAVLCQLFKDGDEKGPREMTKSRVELDYLQELQGLEEDRDCQTSIGVEDDSQGLAEHGDEVFGELVLFPGSNRGACEGRYQREGRSSCQTGCVAKVTVLEQAGVLERAVLQHEVL